MKFKTFYLKEEHSYSCAMLNLNKDLADRIEYFCQNNIYEEDLISSEADGGKPDKFHVTVKYGLLDLYPDKLKELLENWDIGPVTIELSKVNKFQTSDYDVLYLEVHSNELERLNEMFSTELDSVDTQPEYIPHVTLAYLKKNSHNELLENDSFEGFQDTINQIYFTNKQDQEFYIELKKRLGDHPWLF